MEQVSTGIHHIELKQVRDDIIRHRPASITMWGRPDEVAYLSVHWQFSHMTITMFTCSRPAAEVEQMLRDARAWSMVERHSTDNVHHKLGEEYTTDEEE
jgi:hypothetical protein